jgi:hypothetical protein
MKFEYIVECFWPDVSTEQVAAGADRVRQREGGDVRLAGSILFRDDEVVFYLFEGGSAESVREVCCGAEIPCARVLDVVHLPVRRRPGDERRLQ